jgi:hypothetical protein
MARIGWGRKGRRAGVQLLVLLTTQRQAVALEPPVVKHAGRVVLLLLLAKFAHTGIPDQCETLKRGLVLGWRV